MVCSTPNQDRRNDNPRGEVIKNIIAETSIITIEESPPKAEDNCRTSADIRQFLTSESNANSIYKELVKNLNSGPEEDILSKHTIQMRRKDYRRLTGTNFLNDKIIDEYLTVIQERNQQGCLA